MRPPSWVGSRGRGILHKVDQLAQQSDRCTSGGAATLVPMWQVMVACSGCNEDSEVVVENLDDVDREACPCGYSYVVLSVGEFEPVYAQQGKLIELPRRRKLTRA